MAQSFVSTSLNARSCHSWTRQSIKPQTKNNNTRFHSNWKELNLEWGKGNDGMCRKSSLENLSLTYLIQVQIPRNAISSLSPILRKCSIFLSQLVIVWYAAVNKAFHHSPAQMWLKSLSMTAIRSYSSTLTASFAFIRWPIQVGLMIERDLSSWTHSRTSLITTDGSTVSSFTSMTRPK